MSLTGGLTAYGKVNIYGPLSVTGGTATFNSMLVGSLTGAYFMAQQGFTAAFLYAPNLQYTNDIGGFSAKMLRQGLAYVNNGQQMIPYRWGRFNQLSADFSYGYDIVDGNLAYPPPTLPIARKIVKIVDIALNASELTQLALLSDKSLTAFGGVSISPNYAPFRAAISSGTTNFIDIATGGSGTAVPTSTDFVSSEAAGWWLGLMENGRLTGHAWRNDGVISTTNSVITRMPVSLRWDASTGITAKAILGTDDAYCYALLADNSLTAWGATCFMIGGSGGAGTWTTGGTGGILSNFPSAGETFSNFASRYAYRTVGFAIKPDGNLRCFGYTGTTPGLTGAINGIVDYRSVFTTTQTGDAQIVKVDCLYSDGPNALYGGSRSTSAVVSSGTNFYNRQYRTFIDSNYSDSRVFVGLTRGGSLTAGYHVVNQTTLPPNLDYGKATLLSPSPWASTGITYADMVCSKSTIYGLKADRTLASFGPTNGFYDLYWRGENYIPPPLVQGTQTVVRFGGPVNISNVALGQSDPYTTTPLLDIRGGIVAGQISIASDSSVKSNVVDEQTGDGVVSFWKKDLLDNLAPKEFEYLGDPTATKTIGYFAENVEAANPVYVTRINPVNINADRPTSDTGETNTPYSAINLNALMVGTIESLRELDTEMSRIWLTESPPYPSKIKNGDLWYYSGENRLYVRRNNAWIQVN